MRAGRDDAGFTLIEALVAMAVLAAGALGLLTAVERHSALARGLGDRTIARWAAENRLAEISLGLAGPGAETLLGVDWRVAATVTATNDPDLARVDVTAGDAAHGADARLTQLIGFVDATVLAEGILR